MSEKFEQLDIWVDPTPRTGADNMAIDEWLLKTLTDTPRLRFYQWSQPEVSFGYFDKFEVAKQKFNDDELGYVRRWSGGGVVDHRVDTTYTIVIPRQHEWAKLRGAESYQRIHEAVVRALNVCSVSAQLIPQDSGLGSAACFENPVAFDVIGADGSKLAGAGQRRTKWGMLHQGSVQGVEYSSAWREALSNELARQRSIFSPDFSSADIKVLAEKYQQKAWLEAR